MRFVEVTLAAPPDLVAGLDAFYAGMTGETALRFEPGEGEPFYHFALLVPGDRFDAAVAWAEERVELVGGIFDFESWDARAVYFLDLAGNIVELIAHCGLEENGRSGPFAAGEIVGLSELGLVGDKRSLLEQAVPVELGLELWSGSLDDPEGLAFVGVKGRTLILAPTGRGWLPTGRPAERHPFEYAVEV